MFFAYLKRGFAAGLVAGVAFALFVAVLANPLVAFTDELAHGDGVAAEDAGHDGNHHDSAGDGGHQQAADGGHHEGAVSLAVTKAVSAASGLFWGLLLGAVVFGIGFYFLEPVVPGAAGTRSYVVAAAGFVTVSGAPWLVLPPVPPGVEQGLPTDTRIAWYGGMMVAGAACCLLAGLVYDRLAPERGTLVAAATAVLPFGLLAIPVVLAPANPLSGSVPPDLAAAFRGLTLVGQLGTWFVLASAHAWLVRRADDGPAAAVETTLPDAPTAD